MHVDQLLTAAVLLLGASTAAILVFRRIGMGSVLALLATGIVFGPFTPGPTLDMAPLTAAAQLGVVFLLFIIGLELEPRRLWAMRRTLFGLGTLQVVVTGLVLAAAALATGQSWQASLVLGLGLALSSTAFVLQLLSERDELGQEHGRAAFAVLLLQDIAVVPMLALLPLLSPRPDSADAVAWWQTLLLIVAAIGVIAGLGWLALPRALRAVAHQRNAEAFAVMAAFAVMLSAWLAHRAGLSPALGAFLMGVALSRSPFHHQVAAEILPFKSLLLGLFFISVGMSIDLGLLATRWPRILGLVLALILLKGLVIWVLCRLFALAPAAALRTALVMTQGGEFGFVLLAAAASARVIGNELHTTALLVISVSMAATPLLDRLGGWLAPRLSPPSEVMRAISPGAGRHAVIAGYGRVGRAIGDMLEQAGVPFVAVDLDLASVLAARRAGKQVLYGDASDLRLLAQAGTARAAVVIVTLDRVRATEHIVASVRSFHAGTAVIVRARDLESSHRLEHLGASIVVPETLECSLRLGEAALQRLGCSELAVADAIRIVRARHHRAAA